MKCKDCGASTGRCPNCYWAVAPIKSTVAYFHSGTCPVCNSPWYEPCPAHQPTVWSAVKLICKRIPWFYINTATVVLTVLAALIYSWATCDGTVVRGLFWLECLG